MKHAAITALVLAIGCAIPPADVPLPARPGVDFGQQIFHATLEGLYEDGVGNKTVDLILKQDEDGGYVHFVPGCPVCIYVLEAVRHYRARPEFVSFKGGGSTWGKGLPDGERARLASDAMKTRLEAVHDLVERWLDRRMDRLRLDPREREGWMHELEDRSKKGMAILIGERRAGRMPQWGDLRCPSCDGAVDAAAGR